MMALSLIGVSITRSQPNRSSNPSLVLKAPPYTPTSSPSSTTAGSRSISSNIACLMASRKVTCVPFVAAAPLVLAMVTSAPFSKRWPVQSSPFSLPPPLRPPSPPAFRRWRISPHSRASPQQSACRQSELERLCRRSLCPIRIPGWSTPLRHSISAALLRQWAAPISRGSCGIRPRCSTRPSRPIFRKLPLAGEQRVELPLDLFLAAGVEKLFACQKLFVQRDGIARLPVSAHFLRHVLSRVMLRVTQPPESLGLVEDWSLARAGPFDCFLSRRVHRDHVIAIYDVTLDTVSFGAVGQVFERHLPADRRRICP